MSNTKEPQLMEDKVEFYINKAIECYSGHALTGKTLFAIVMKLSNGSINPHDVIKTITNDHDLPWFYDNNQ